MNEKLNPGSKEAIAAGCTCPVMDNHHGAGFPIKNNKTGEMTIAFWHNAECPIHGTRWMFEEERQGN